MLNVHWYLFTAYNNHYVNVRWYVIKPKTNRLKLASGQSCPKINAVFFVFHFYPFSTRFIIVPFCEVEYVFSKLQWQHNNYAYVVNKIWWYFFQGNLIKLQNIDSFNLSNSLFSIVELFTTFCPLIDEQTDHILRLQVATDMIFCSSVAGVFTTQSEFIWCINRLPYLHIPISGLLYTVGARNLQLLCCQLHNV